MDFKAGIYDTIDKFISTSSDEAVQDLYYKLTELMQERDNDKVYQCVINAFFSSNSFYYNPTTNMYIGYTDQYKFISENEMIHTVLQFLTKYHNSAIEFCLKQRIKNKIIKKIKEKHIHQNIPESNTLQDILNFLQPNFFTHKNYGKSHNFIDCNTYFIFRNGQI